MKTAAKKTKSKKTVSEPVKKSRTRTAAMIANPGGRPTDFDKAAPKIVEYVRKGNTFNCAAACARVSYSSFCSWMRQGKEDFEDGILDSKFLKFMHDVQQAEKDCEAEVLGYWKREMPGNWKACQEYLARRHYSDWGSKDKVDVTSAGEAIGQPLFLPLKISD